MARPPTARQNETVIKILTKQYSSFGKEAEQIAKQFNAQVRYIQLGAALMLGLASAASSEKLKSVVDLAGVGLLWQLGAFALSTFIYYLFWRVVENRYEMLAISIGLSTCERQINSRLGSDVLVWNSVVVPRLWSPVGIGLGFPPGLGAAVYAFILTLAVATTIPVLIYLRYFPTAPLFRALVVAAIAYTTVSPIVLAVCLSRMMSVGWSKANAFVQGLSSETLTAEAPTRLAVPDPCPGN